MGFLDVDRSQIASLMILFVGVIAAFIFEFSEEDNYPVYSISFGLAMYFLVMAFASFVNPAFHTDHWLFKIFFVAGLLVVGFFLPESSLDTWAEISRTLSVIYLVIQIFLLINFAYDLHEILLTVDEANDGEELVKRRQCIYLTLVVILFALTITGCVLMWTTYDCDTSLALVSSTFILGLVCFIASTLQCTIDAGGGKGSLPPIIVWSYSTYVTWTAVSSNEDLDCNPSLGESSPEMIVIAIFVTTISMVYASWSLSSRVSAMNCSCCSRKKEEEEMPPVGDDSEEAKEAKQKIISNKMWLFYTVLCLAATYVAMLVTNWGTEGKSSPLSKSEINMWAKMISVWVIYVLYLWTIFAPLICKDRDFS